MKRRPHPLKAISRPVLPFLAATFILALTPFTTASPALADPTPQPSTASSPSPISDAPTSLLPSPEAAADTPGVLGLLPWPEQTKPVLPDPEAGADAGPIDSEDEAVILYDKIQTENQLMQDAVMRLPGAKQRAAEAHAVARQATATALTLRDQSAIAADKAEGTIRGLYMQGGTPDLTEFMFASNGSDAFEMLLTQDQLNAAAHHNVVFATDLKDQSAAADSAAVAAMQAANEADAEVVSIEAEIETHSQAAADAAKAYNDFISVTGPQLTIGPDGCPTNAPFNALRDGSDAIGITELCRKSVALAVTPQAALAIKWAFTRLGAPYACKGLGRLEPWRFDCSSYVSRAYAEGAGVPVARPGWAPSTRNMMPWDGVPLDSHYQEVPSTEVAPGDLILTRSCTHEPCIYQHVYMAIADGYMMETSGCNDIAHISRDPGYGPGTSFVVARRVILLDGETIPAELMPNTAILDAIPIFDTTPSG